MKSNIVLLPGDGIGPEVVASAQKVLETVASLYGHQFDLRSYAIGGCAIDEHNNPLPEVTLAACQEADAILLGAVGGPKWDDPSASMRPEAGLLELRKRLSLYGNLRPVKPHPDLMNASPIKAERLAGVDLLVVRELTSGIYFGEPRLRRQVNNETQAIDTMSYTESEIRRVAHLAFRLAGDRKGLLTSVDKANVLECSRLWRTVVGQVAADYPDVKLEYLLVDAAAMHLLTRPATFDVLLTANLFGDILTDEASVLSGSMGNLPSASLGDRLNAQGMPRGLYEPIHGSAPDIAGRGIANPVGTLMSAAMLLRHSLGLESEALAIEEAVDKALSAGTRTPDLGGAHNTAQVTESIIGILTAEPVTP
jgi:3-isopropylmalate dehydrogenase